MWTIEAPTVSCRKAGPLVVNQHPGQNSFTQFFIGVFFKYFFFSVIRHSLALLGNEILTRPANIVSVAAEAGECSRSQISIVSHSLLKKQWLFRIRALWAIPDGGVCSDRGLCTSLNKWVMGPWDRLLLLSNELPHLVSTVLSHDHWHWSSSQYVFCVNLF